MLLALLKPRELARLETTTKNYKLLARLYLMVEKIIVAENMDKTLENPEESKWH